MDEEKLYHYTTSAGLIGILKSKKIWASEIRFLNDMQEFSRALELLQELNRSILAESGRSPSPSTQLSRLLNLPKHLITGLFVTSFSEEGNSLGQWRGYCPKGGFSVGFNADYIRRTFEPKKCIYDIDEQKTFLSTQFVSALQEIHELMAGKSVNALSEKEISHMIWEYESKFESIVDLMKQYAPIIKHHKFSEEKEWRIVKAVDIKDESVEFRAGQYQPIPYISLDIDIQEIEQIVIGPTPEPEIALNSIVCLLQHYEMRCDKIVIDVVPFRSW